LAGYQGPPDLIEEMNRQARLIAGYLASLRPSRILPAAQVRTGRLGRFALSTAQRGWIDSSRNALQEQWQPFIWKLDGLLNLQAFRDSFRKLIERHEILRTHYVREEGGVLQEVAGVDAVPLMETDLRQLPESERQI